MNNSHLISPKTGTFYLVFSVIALSGIYLRLDQFSLQVLLDDEWHVIHQLLARTPSELVQTFGLADFSIPLALFYWLETQLFGLSEMGMRWPMMLAGIALLCLAPFYVRQYFGNLVALIFMLLLAVSPRLIVYSKTARPYALTLLMSMLALAAFQKFVDSDEASLKWGSGYVFCAVICSWLHVISLPLVVAPFLVHGLGALVKRDWLLIGRLFKLGIITLAGLLLVVLPPLLGDPTALAIKMGSELPDLQTWYGSLFAWVGTSSRVVVAGGVLLAVLGVGRLWRELPISKSLVTGLILVTALILLTEPAWIQYPVTLSRYLLAFIPFLLLGMALGAVRLTALLERVGGMSGRVMSMSGLLAFALLMAYHSPLRMMMNRPNSNMLHSALQFDYRDEMNQVARYQAGFPVSPFWKKLATLPPDSIKVAASPFSFETHHWDAARWEQISRQRVMPGFLTGFCEGSWWGEVPEGRGYRFRNVGYLSDQADLVERGFDLVVFQKPTMYSGGTVDDGFALKAGHCEPEFRKSFPVPVYEDQWLLVFPLNEDMRSVINATR